MLFCSIIIPVFNHSGLTRQCLKALLSETDLPCQREIIVVNDASTDDTVELLASYHAQIRVVTLKTNQGFAAACNAGAAAAQGDYVVFLNNDTLAQPGWLAALANYQTAHPQVAAIGARLLFPDGTVQHAGVIIGQNCEPWHLYAGLPGDHPAVCQSRRFQIVTGACLWMPRALFAEVGGFDTAFRNGYEDVDLCLRLSAQGREIHYCHESVIIHFESQTRGRTLNDHDARNYALYRTRWAEIVRPDDIDYYLADGTLKINYGRQHRLTVDAAFNDEQPLQALTAELAEINRTHAAQLVLHEQQLQAATAELAETNRAHATQLAIHEQQLQALTNELTQANRTHVAQLVLKEQQLQALTNELTQTNRAYATQLAFKEDQFQAVTDELAETSSQLSHQLVTSAEQVGALAAELDQIKSSRGWRWLGFYWELKHRYLLPVCRWLGFSRVR